MKLTQANIAKIRLPAGKSEHIAWDDTLPGFGLRIRDGGSKTWIAQYKIGAQHRRLTLGSTAMLTAEQARNGWQDAAGKKQDGAAIILANARQGTDAANVRQVKRAAASLTVEASAHDFLAFQEARRKPSYMREMRRYMLETWKSLHGLPIDAVTRAHVATILSKVARESGPVAADRARAALSKFFNWAIAEGRAMANPVGGTNRATEGKEARDRVLSDAELVAVWNTAPDSVYGMIIRLLILTGQRRDEIGGLRWSEVDLVAKQITLPGERTKNGKTHVVPLSDDAVAILAAMPQRADSDFVFGRGVRGFADWSGSKVQLDDASGVKGWTVHDLRRTAATRMIDAGVLPHVVEAVLNHVSGHRSGVAGIYNRSTYDAEKRAALDTLASYIRTALATASGANVKRLKVR